MRYAATIAVITLLSAPCVVYAQSRNPIPNGFRELKWGSNLTRNFVLVRDGNVYRRPADDLRIGRLTAKKIEYVFRDNRLQSVQLLFEGESARRLEAVFTENFGDANSLVGNGPGLSTWQSEHTTVVMLTSEDRSRGLVTFSERE